MPPKPVPYELGSGPEFYNVDFTLQTQLRMATGAPPPPLRKQKLLSLMLTSSYCDIEIKNDWNGMVQMMCFLFAIIVIGLGLFLMPVKHLTRQK